MAFRIMKDNLFLAITEEKHYSYDDYSDIDTAITTNYSWIDDEDKAYKFLTKQEAIDLLAKNWKKSFYKNAVVQECWL
ncbi:hypothetical protein KTJ16_00455 [Acinetobacter bereziniae]|uniref:hypothetical protein n=1 Tax=Acinetobacter bereziniae TaxID=106648 RepID=UPI0021CD5971|nr:hypothetical protein [Acinetobacter bereziniae]MCU4539650.1 hypothetical protein [Acinetobacter bereziniae]MCU4624171.1 hypothetical protein [Acinetobacter bereziniae]